MEAPERGMLVAEGEVKPVWLDSNALEDCQPDE
jgi:hypothetical protein